MKPSILLAMVAACAGCTDSVDPSRILVGQWGNPSAELIALRSGAEPRFDCSVIVIDEPLELLPDNQFGARGELWGSGASVGDPPRATISGTMAGNGVTLRVATGTQWFSLTLEAGVVPQPDEVPVCPL